MDYTTIKPSTIAAIRRYADHHIQTGGFLRAVLSNNLVEAVGMADEENLKALPEIVRYCYNEIPGNCWGSERDVEKWLYQERYEVAAPGVLSAEKVSAEDYDRQQDKLIGDHSIISDYLAAKGR